MLQTAPNTRAQTSNVATVLRVTSGNFLEIAARENFA